ncbi:hypothetical protein [Actinokineospora iranica]|uniref:Uncharacterized protein n=1 Tax=Actinokineospora iranica TaxID=1271860 RepID=A0A1G6JVU4_9PSEU|nr:hypothetical protein [Actinokineospora iranica]SDC22860.1 hypothetical protein SAMN05216174_101586 [Actinokineospora iranica]
MARQAKGCALAGNVSSRCSGSGDLAVRRVAWLLGARLAGVVPARALPVGLVLARLLPGGRLLAVVPVRPSGRLLALIPLIPLRTGRRLLVPILTRRWLLAWLSLTGVLPSGRLRTSLLTGGGLLVPIPLRLAPVLACLLPGGGLLVRLTGVLPTRLLLVPVLLLGRVAAVVWLAVRGEAACPRVGVVWQADGLRRDTLLGWGLTLVETGGGLRRGSAVAGLVPGVRRSTLGRRRHCAIGQGRVLLGSAGVRWGRRLGVVTRIQRITSGLLVSGERRWLDWRVTGETRLTGRARGGRVGAVGLGAVWRPLSGLVAVARLPALVDAGPLAGGRRREVRGWLWDASALLSTACDRRHTCRGRRAPAGLAPGRGERRATRRRCSPTLRGGHSTAHRRHTSAVLPISGGLRTTQWRPLPACRRGWHSPCG